MLRAILEQIAAGSQVDRAQAVALVLPTLMQAQRLAALADAVLTARDAEFEQRLRSLVEAMLASHASPAQWAAQDDVEESS